MYTCIQAQCYFYPNQSRRLKTHQSQKRIFAYFHNSLVTELVTRILRNLSRVVISWAYSAFTCTDIVH